jgi:hypothetical protein
VSPKVTAPPSGCSCPVSIRKSVVLPAPFGPMTPTMPPGGREKVRSSIRSLSPMAFFSPSTSITLEPRRGPFGMMIWARAIFSRSDCWARSL